MGNALDIVKFQVFFKQSIYCVTLNPGVTLGPRSLRQGVTDHFTTAAPSSRSTRPGPFHRLSDSGARVCVRNLCRLHRYESEVALEQKKKGEAKKVVINQCFHWHGAETSLS